MKIHFREHWDSDLKIDETACGLSRYKQLLYVSLSEDEVTCKNCLRVLKNQNRRVK